MQQQRARTLPRLAAVFVGLAVLGILAVVLIPSGSGSSAKKPSAAAPTPAAAGPVNVSLTDFKIAPAAGTVPAGKVTFVAKNAGKAPHEMVIVRTNKPAADLLKGKRADESASVGEIGEFKPGGTVRKSFNLKPGHYVLLCNVPGHFMAGMHTEFTVK